MSRQSDITALIEQPSNIIDDDEWRRDMLLWLSDMHDEEIVEIMRGTAFVLAVRMSGNNATEPSVEGVYHWLLKVAHSFVKGAKSGFTD